MYLFLFPVIVLYTASSILYKRNKKSVILSLFGVGFWATIILGIVFILNFAITKHPFAHFTWGVYGLIFLKACIVVLCIFTWVKGIKHVPASIADPFTYIRMLGLLVVSWFLFNDKVGFLSIILVGVVLVSCVLVGVLQIKTEQKSANKKNFIQGLLWLLAWVLCSTANITIFKYISKSGINVVTQTTVEQATYTLITFVILVISRRPVLKSLDEVMRYPVFIGLGSTYLADLMYIPLLLIFNMGVLDAILSVTMVLVTLISVIFYKEKIRPLVYPFIVIIIACSIALSLLAT